MDSRYIDYKEFNNALDRLMQGETPNFEESAVTANGDGAANPACADGGSGSLLVQVVTANGALPVSGAKVTISGNDGRIINEQYTDNSGRIESVALCTPPGRNSQSPGEGLTYSTYNVRVEKEGYFTDEFLNLAVFDKIESIQNVSLEPIGENAFANDMIIARERAINGENGAGNIIGSGDSARIGDALIIREQPRPAADTEAGEMQ